MAGANPSAGFEEMMALWKEGQESYVKIQQDFAHSFEPSHESHGDPLKDAVQENMNIWHGMVQSWTDKVGQFSASDFVPQNASQTDAFSAFAAAPFSEMANPNYWMRFAPENMKEILSSIAQSPRFADLASPQVEAAETWQEVLECQQALLDFGNVIKQAWGKAFEEFAKSHDLEELKSGDFKKPLDAWLKAANAALLIMQRSAPYLAAQKRLLKASLALKARQANAAEKWSATYQMPTRTEVDDLALTLHQLRRELRDVKSELSRLKAST